MVYKSQINAISTIPFQFDDNGNLLISIANISDFGTVTDVSVVSANGVSGSVANPTTTPAITLTLGAITPTGDITIANGKAIKTDTTTAHTALIQGYDVDGTAYVTFGTITNGNTPSFALSAPAGSSMSIDNATIGATTPTTAKFTTVNSSSITFNTGTGIKTGQTVGNTALYSAYDTTNSVDKVFLTATAGTTPTFAFAQPANGTLTWDGGAIGLTTAAAAKFTTITSNSHTFNTGTGLKTSQSAGNTYFLSVYDVDGATDTVFGTATANNTPSLAFAQPAGGTLTWDGGAIGSITPATGAFTTITSNSHTFNTGTGLKTAQSAGNTYLLSAYDVDGAVDKVFMTFTANNTPTCDLSPPSGGTLTISNVTGITSGASAASGIIGEYLQANLASGSAITLNTGVNTDIVSQAYTAGVWRVDLSTRVVYSGITSTVILFFGGDTTGDNQSGVTAYNTQHIEHPAAGASGTVGGVVSYYINASGSGTVYLKINATFTVGSATGYGAIQMYRVR